MKNIVPTIVTSSPWAHADLSLNFIKHNTSPWVSEDQAIDPLPRYHVGFSGSLSEPHGGWFDADGMERSFVFGSNPTG